MIKRNVLKQYNVIYADPAWTYDNKNVKFNTTKKSKDNFGAKTQYTLTSLEDMKNMPVINLSQKDAVCFMWCVNPMLPEAFELLSAWGFKYKTMITWEKTKGSGYWFEGVTEHILFGVRGNVKAFRSRIKNIHHCKNSKHSRKPHYFRKMIEEVTEKYMDNPVRLELFARSREGFFPDEEYHNWDVWGDEVNNSIDLNIYK